MNKSYIINLANTLINELLECSDGDFVDEVIAAITFGEEITEYDG